MDESLPCDINIITLCYVIAQVPIVVRWRTHKLTLYNSSNLCNYMYKHARVVYTYSGVVFIVHGVGEHSGRYEHSGLGPYLMEHQYAVHSHDHG